MKLNTRQRVVIGLGLAAFLFMARSIYVGDGFLRMESYSIIEQTIFAGFLIGIATSVVAFILKD